MERMCRATWNSLSCTQRQDLSSIPESSPESAEAGGVGAAILAADGKVYTGVSKRYGLLHGILC